MREEILRMENVTREIHGIQFLDNLNLRIFKGEIMGAIFINVLGKKELLALLCQNLPINYGRIYVNNCRVNYYEHSSMSRNRIYVIEEKSRLIKAMSVSDNIFVLRRGFKKWIINKNTLAKQVQYFIKELGIKIDPNELIENLAPLEQYSVDLLKAVLSGANLIIINDISNVLSALELLKFYELLRYYQKRGFSFLYIGSHHQELLKICDRVMLIENGQTLKVFDQGELSEEKIKPYTIDFHLPSIHKNTKEGFGLLTLKNVVTKKIQGLSFCAQKGECLVLLDMDNLIFSDLLALIHGEKEVISGEILWKGKPFLKKQGKNFLTTGIGIIEANPSESMIFKERSYSENLCFLVDKKMKHYVIKNKYKKSITEEYKKILGDEIYAKDLRALDLKSLYNVVYYRFHLYHPDLVFCIQPFAGADMYLRRHVLDLIQALKKKGITVIILAINISDALAAADRLMIIEAGKVVKEYNQEEFDLYQK